MFRVLAPSLMACLVTLVSSSAVAEEVADAAPRPPPLEASSPLGVPRQRHVDVTLFAQIVNHLGELTDEGLPSRVSYAPGIGLGFQARVMFFDYLGAALFLGGSMHAVTLEAGALGVSDTFEPANLSTFHVGARVLPTLPLAKRFDLRLVLGVGWGRFEFGAMNGSRSGTAYFVPDRSHGFVAFPVGLSAQVELIPDWLSLDWEGTFSPKVSLDGTSREPMQVLIDGRREHVGALPASPWDFTQALGLSLLL